MSKPHLNTMEFQELERNLWPGMPTTFARDPEHYKQAQVKEMLPPHGVSTLTQWKGLAWSNDPESYVGGSIATGRNRSHCKKHKCLETSTEWRTTSGKQYGLLSRYMECENPQ